MRQPELTSIHKRIPLIRWRDVFYMENVKCEM